jgi:hypothetical protein
MTTADDHQYRNHLDKRDSLARAELTQQAQRSAESTKDPSILSKQNHRMKLLSDKVGANGGGPGSFVQSLMGSAVNEAYFDHSKNENRDH